jgi:hypothetical protein
VFHPAKPATDDRYVKLIAESSWQAGDFLHFPMDNFQALLVGVPRQDLEKFFHFNC